MGMQFHIPERGPMARLADTIALPVMRLLAQRGESPQLTHFWNNMRLPRAAADYLNLSLMVHVNGDAEAPHRMHALDLRFHLGWWSRFVVLEPSAYHEPWFVGWITKDACGASQIPITRRVRMLIGPDDVSFFGVKQSTHAQIDLSQVGEGRLGGGTFQDVPLQ